ncbi:MAG: hypothetical protein GY913_27290 [Proteobacteria bacterium]|nr:hypothetical protein [Pseudomonadota bacterium]
MTTAILTAQSVTKNTNLDGEQTYDAIDADITLRSGRILGSVTLIRNDAGYYATWGDYGMWGDSDIMRAVSRDLDHGHGDLEDMILDAVNEAVF